MPRLRTLLAGALHRTAGYALGGAMLVSLAAAARLTTMAAPRARPATRCRLVERM